MLSGIPQGSIHLIARDLARLSRSHIRLGPHSGVQGKRARLGLCSNEIGRPFGTSTLNSGPFPPPALPGFNGTTGLSATPGGPACPSRASGWGHAPPPPGVSRVASDPLCRHAVAITPAGSLGGRSEVGLSTPRVHQRRRPSPFRWRVGSHIIRFEACSAFTRVTACPLAESLDDPFHRRLRRLRYLRRRSDCYRLERPSCRVGVAPAEEA